MHLPDELLTDTGSISSPWKAPCANTAVAVGHAMRYWRMLRERESDLAFPTVQVLSCSSVWQVRKLRGIMGITKPEAGLLTSKAHLLPFLPMALNLRSRIIFSRGSCIIEACTPGPRAVLPASALTCAAWLLDAWELCQGLPEQTDKEQDMSQ